MPNFNQVTYAGHFTRDVNLKYLPNQTACAEFCLAANRKWTDQGGTKHEEVCYLDFTAYGNTAELISKYCRTGSAVLVVGRLKYDTWQGNDGKKHAKISGIVGDIQFLGKCGLAQPAGSAAGPGNANEEVQY